MTHKLTRLNKELSQGRLKVEALEKEKAKLLKRVGSLEREIKSNDDEVEAKKENKNREQNKVEVEILELSKFLEKEAFKHGQFICYSQERATAKLQVEKVCASAKLAKAKIVWSAKLAKAERVWSEKLAKQEKLASAKLAKAEFPGKPREPRSVDRWLRR